MSGISLTVNIQIAFSSGKLFFKRMIVNVRYYLVVETPSARWNESKAQSVGTSMYTKIRIRKCMVIHEMK